ncbi:hypothetical protein ACVWXM_009699 [Bradyrhizobium sp. GM7.3]
MSPEAFLSGSVSASDRRSTIGLAREQPIAIDRIEQRHWLAPQGMDHVPIMGYLVVLAVEMRPPTRQGDEMSVAGRTLRRSS